MKTQTYRGDFVLSDENEKEIIYRKTYPTCDEFDELLNTPYKPTPEEYESLYKLLRSIRHIPIKRKIRGSRKFIARAKKVSEECGIDIEITWNKWEITATYTLLNYFDYECLKYLSKVAAMADSIGCVPAGAYTKLNLNYVTHKMVRDKVKLLMPKRPEEYERQGIPSHQVSANISG